MELLLRHDIEHLGRVGELVKVRPGYARNFLLPNGFAVTVTKANMHEIERARATAFALEQERISGLKELSQQLTETSITIEGRANEEGHLFGSVTAQNVVVALKEKGFTFEERQIRLDQPIKEIGVFDVGVHLHEGVDATVKVWVVQQKPE